MQNKALKQVLNLNIREIGLLCVIIVLAILVNVRSGGNFLTPKNISDMFTETSILIIMSMGMMMVIITGGIDLSIGSTMALAGMVGTTVLKNNMNLHPVIIILIAIIVGLCAGLFNGFLVSRLHILPLIATLGSMNVFRGITYMVSGGSWVLQQNMSTAFMAVATGNILGINNMIWIALVIFVVNYFFMNYIRTGRQIYAVGNSAESAQVSGINVKNVKLLAYAVMGTLAGIGGILYVCKYAAAQGETATGYEMNIIASCVLGGVSVSGGVGKVHGAVLGAVLFGLLSNALPLLKVSSFWQEAIRGLIILCSILINALVSRRVAKKALTRRAA